MKHQTNLINIKKNVATFEFDHSLVFYNFFEKVEILNLLFAFEIFDSEHPTQIAVFFHCHGPKWTVFSQQHRQ